MLIRILMILLFVVSVAGAAFRLEIDAIIELPCDDCDGVALGDINNNGRMDILASSGDNGEVFWFEQGGDHTEWRKYLIYAPEDFTGEFEGNDLADFDGDGTLEAISLNQKRGEILLHKRTRSEEDPWQTAVIRADRQYVQASRALDYTGNGRTDLLYTWEGDAPGRGGVHLLTFTGDDLLNPEHWHDRVLMQHESAWWLARERLDWTGNGHADIVYTARNIRARNAGARPGLYLLEGDADASMAPLRRVIDDRLPHPLQVDFGDISGAGHGMDLAVGGFDTRILYWYAHEENWARHEIALPDEVNGVVPDRIWNIKTIPMPGSRDALLAPITDREKGALVCFEFIDSAWQPNVLLLLDYRHPMDDRIILHDLSGNGIPEAIIPDSGIRTDVANLNRLLIISFKISPAS